MVNHLAAEIAPRPRIVAIDIRRAVDVELARFVDAHTSTVATCDDLLAPFLRVARDAVVGGGKRIRPTFAYWAWFGCAPDPDAVHAVLPALAALDMLHSFALVHDDVMDASELRRNRPTAHRAFTDLHDQQRLRGDGRRFGASAAILVGDLCLTWADQMIAAADIPADTKLDARLAYDQMRVEAIAGQYLDVYSDHAATWSTERAARTARLKTASYTVTWPLLYGVALAGGNHPATRAGMRRYGNSVGVAFQWRDDLLGMYGDPTVTGKPIGDDQSTAKPTMLLQLARRLADHAQATALDQALAHRPRRPAAIADIVERTGARRQLEAMIADEVDRARTALADIPIREPAREALDRLAADAAWRVA